MTNQGKVPSQELLAGRRALESMKGIELLSDCTWNIRVKKWVFHCRLSPSISPESQVPATTEWYVLVDEAYPWGSIKFYPSKEHSIVQTFPHQSFNSEGAKELPWRDGDICLDTVVRVLGRHGYDTEPYGIYERLRWRFERALDWLQAAAKDELACSGEPFELPSFPVSYPSITTAFCEGQDTFTAWCNTTEQAGLAELGLFDEKRALLFVRRFKSCDGRELVVPKWGLNLQNMSEESLLGIWLRIDFPPVHYPWQAPTTWQELRTICAAQDIDIDRLLGAVAKFIRDGRRHVALLGFPIPARVGDTPCQLHWQTFMLPNLSRGSQVAKGFRSNERGHWQRDRTEVLTGETFVDWLASENWHAARISARGRLAEMFISRKVLLIGVGAVGSALAELLVRAGLPTLTIMDGDLLETGNLARHILGLGQVNTPKARAVADWLNQLTPVASVQALGTGFPPVTRIDQSLVEECDIVIDCTGRDEVLHYLETYAWQAPKLFFSISLGLQAKRLFLFAASRNRFPHLEFNELIAPWLTREVDEHKGEEWPREGIGCWHPIFPARVDDIRMLVSIALKCIESLVGTPPAEPELVVFEQQYNNGRLISVNQTQL